MMIKPVKFGYNNQTALDNVYQKSKIKTSTHEIAKKAIFEYEQFVSVLRNSGINIIEFQDNEDPLTPDSIFPNNWISTHGDGSIFLYPMFASNRRNERRNDILNYFKTNFQVSSISHDFLNYELDNKFLEGTGSMVLDRVHKIAYACISNRTEKKLFEEWCDKMHFTPLSFYANDQGHPVYHTNVLMSVCENLVFICLEAVVGVDVRQRLLDCFNESNKEVVVISKSQMRNFLGNVLEIQNIQGESFLVMSTSAFEALDNVQKKSINKKIKILHSPLNTIEYFGGGSARCMIAEIFLKPNNSIVS